MAISPPTSRVPFVPAGAVTGIGSLPLTSVSSAIHNVAALSSEVPFWPQLPKLAARESAVGQGLDIVFDLIEPRLEGYGYQVKAGRLELLLETLYRSIGQLTPSNAAGFHAFKEGIDSGLFRSAIALKGQISGPITLAAFLFHNDRPFLADSTLFAAVAFHVSQIVCWQIEKLTSAGLPVLLFVDEPALCLDAPFANRVSEEERLSALAAILASARVRGAYAGLHCCAARPFESMCRVQPDILSFDSHEGLDSFFANSDALNFARRGGFVAYGIIPTRKRLEADAPGIFVRWLKAASLAGDPQDLARNAMITATCGLGLLEESSVAQSFGVAHQVSQLLRSLAE